MKRSLRIGISIVAGIAGGFLWKNLSSTGPTKQNDSVQSPISESFETPSVNESTTDKKISDAKPPQKEHPDVSSAIELTEGNFESFVQKCFQGESCTLIEDPTKLYEDFKISHNTKANDQLISFLRKNLKDAAFREQYKDKLKKMIDDFYPAEERQFQDAAYYNYVGDLQKSLDLYLDLEKKAALDPTLRPAPKLNIANTYYDMGKLRESLPYYEAALIEHTWGRTQSGIPNSNEMIRFIENRISEIKSKLGV